MTTPDRQMSSPSRPQILFGVSCFAAGMSVSAAIFQVIQVVSLLGAR